ncbi:carboxypeptidase-like regulatory domain-containing protein [Hymenobacter oligotrophus]|uniref:Carboxypeptidase-like regulatory domain-containing protein n=1 Tax=Hymenobacter oligotrophus TaxID=2319843 RepID=A0A3B7R869_9BACT|nr:carboxypeptidase-like regulatory domain-containing protein [Hymenobacter oligotrophus]AYA37321.1 carboxypeptidase-like regulatory domain-containing protein [Hymenobacter oligotrophus]
MDISLVLYRLILRRWLGLLAVLLCLWAAAPASAQTQVRVTGSISDKDTRQDIPGAAVINQRTRRGVVANEQGEFSLVAQPTDTLEFRAIGYASYRMPLGGTGLSQLIVQVKLQRTSVQLTGVTIREGRPDDATINKALRNIRRPTPPPNAVKRPPRPKPLFPVDSTAPKVPVPTLANPISFIYDQFSREGEQRRKMEEIQAQKQYNDELARRRAYNRLFRINKGYEVETDSAYVPISVPRTLPALPAQPMQPPAGSLAPKR